MKKILLFIVLLFWFWISQSFAWVVYTNSSNLYLKTSTWTDNWTAITSSWGSRGSLSPDWTKIVYVHSSWKLYLKTSTWTDEWTAINTLTTSQAPTFSPDGNYIIYAAWTTRKLYKKTSDWIDDWSIINSQTVYATSKIEVSPDWLYIYYNSTSGTLYKKNFSDSSNWTLIWNFPARWHTLYWSGYIIYWDWINPCYIKTTTWTDVWIKITNSNCVHVSSDKYSTKFLYTWTWWYIFEKTSTWLSDWTQKNSLANSSYPFYTDSIPLESCSDWIQNQWETGIDVGGPCWLNSFAYSGTFFTWSNIQCSTKKFNDPNSTFTRFTDFGDMTPTPFGNGSGETIGGTVSAFFNIYWDIGYDDCTSNCLNKDAFRWIYFNNGSYLPHTVMKFNTSSIANVEYFASRNSVLSDTNSRIRIFRKRNGEYTKFNAIQCSWTWNNQGCDFATLWNITNWSFIETVSKFDLQPCSVDSEWSNTCTILFNQYWQYTELYIKSWFTGFRFWNSWTGTINKIECKNDSYGCEWVNTGTWFFCSWVTKYDPEIWTIDWQCGVDINWYCGPIENFRTPWFNEHAILDWSGNVIWIWQGYTDNVDLTKDVVDDIFSCPDYKSWTDTPSCIIQITKNIYLNFKKWINNLLKGPHSVSTTVQTIWSWSSQREFWTVNNTGANLVDDIYRRSWNKAFDKNETLTAWSRAWLYGSILLILLAVVLLIVSIKKNK